jgi:hypothetical protein
MHYPWTGGTLLSRIPEMNQESPGDCVGRNVAQREDSMNVARWIRVIAGTFVLASLFLGLYVSRYWFLFTAFVGLNLFQSGITKWCLMEDILKKLGVPEE